MQFDMIAYPNFDLRHCALVFDPEIAVNAQFKNSSEAMKGFDASSLSGSAIGFYASENLVKFRFFVNEQPLPEIVAKQNRKTGIFRSVSGILCAGWVTHTQKNELWIFSLPNEERNGFAGDFKQIAPGNYTVEMYGLLEAVPPPKPPAPSRWYDVFVGCGAITAIGLLTIGVMALPIGAPVAAFVLHDWRYLLFALPYVLFIAFLYWNAKREPQFWTRMANDYLAKSPDVAVVLNTMPSGMDVSGSGSAYLIRSGVEKEAQSRKRFQENGSFQSP